MPENAFQQFEGQPFLNLETYRKNGQAVRTPVWFSMKDNVIYVRTGADSGKVKRIRRDGQARIVPCTTSGEPRGQWVPARARLATTEEAELANQLGNKKYGLQKRFFELMSGLQGRKWTTLRIEPGE